MKSRKNKICCKLWLTRDEKRLFKKLLKERIYSIAWAIIAKAYKRGDFEMEEKNNATT